MPSPPRSTRGDSEAVEDYIRAIFRTARGPRQVASTTEVADFLGVTPASVSNMFKKLARRELVLYLPYRGVSLTADGPAELEGLIAARLGEPSLDPERDPLPRGRSHDGC